MGAAGRDLIEAGLNEAAVWRSGYGDCGCGGWSETLGRVHPAGLWGRSGAPSGLAGRSLRVILIDGEVLSAPLWAGVGSRLLH